MNKNILLEYKNSGIDLNKLIFSKDYRDKNKCNFSEYKKEDWIQIK
jgi:hypothetical protein